MSFDEFLEIFKNATDEEKAMIVDFLKEFGTQSDSPD